MESNQNEKKKFTNISRKCLKFLLFFHNDDICLFTCTGCGVLVDVSDKPLPHFRCPAAAARLSFDVLLSHRLSAASRFRISDRSDSNGDYD